MIFASRTYCERLSLFIIIKSVFLSHHLARATVIFQNNFLAHSSTLLADSFRRNENERNVEEIFLCVES